MCPEGNYESLEVELEWLQGVYKDIEPGYGNFVEIHGRLEAAYRDLGE